jgi:hypothetical protein
MQALLETQKCTGMPKFGGGSDRIRALLGDPVPAVHDMQMAQGRINTGYFASRRFGKWGRSSVG